MASRQDRARKAGRDRARQRGVATRPARVRQRTPRRSPRSSVRARGDRAGLGPSATALAAEALRTGILPAHQARLRVTLPREDEKIRVGDPDDDSLANEYVGDETPGGSSATPDQNVLDEIGRAYGLQEEDAGDFHSAAEILTRRDHNRAELRPPKKSRY